MQHLFNADAAIKYELIRDMRADVYVDELDNI